jgi:ABC-type branched-subunit amino acid transport system substrate-binding protein
MRHRLTLSPFLVVLVVSALLAGCGTQVADSRRRALAQAQLSGGSGPSSSAAGTGGLTGSETTPGATAGQPGGSTTGAVATTTGATSTTSGAPSGTRTTGGSGTRSGTTGGTGTSTATTGSAAAPPGGNGGATDKGVTATSILIGNVSDLSGPQPGLFKTAVAGTNAYLAYVNSQGGLFGRQLKITVADSQTSCDGDRAGHQQNVDKVFAFAGSFSLFDQCGATVLKDHPDVPDAHLAVTPDANGLPNNFSVNPVGTTSNNGPFAWARDRFGADSVAKAAFMYVNLPAVTNVAALQKHSAESVGWQFPYTRAVGATETDFTADIIQMRNKGIKVFYTLFNADEMANFKQQADQQNYKPVLIAPLVYDQTFFQKLGGSAAAENIYGYNSQTLFFGREDAARVPSVALFQKYYAQVSGGAAADTFAADGWAETALLVQAMRAAGPALTRKKVLTELSKITTFNADGFFSTSNPAAKRPGNCYVIWKVQGGQYKRTDTPETAFRCDGKLV